MDCVTKIIECTLHQRSRLYCGTNLMVNFCFVFFFFLVAVCGLGVAAKEVKDGFFKKRIVVKQG